MGVNLPYQKLRFITKVVTKPGQDWHRDREWAPLEWNRGTPYWLRIRLPTQGTQGRALVWEDPTCRRATKPMHHNYWACTLEPTSHNYWAHVPQLLKPAHLEPMLRNKRSHRNEKPAAETNSSPCSPQLEKPHAQQWRPKAAKNK